MEKEQEAPSVKIEKPGSRPKKESREKCCTTCGRPFTLEPGKKFFDCPHCYQKKKSSQIPERITGASVLTKINCATCGKAEFVGFVPDDPLTVLCGACFSKMRREQRR